MGPHWLAVEVELMVVVVVVEVMVKVKSRNRVAGSDCFVVVVGRGGS